MDLSKAFIIGVDYKDIKNSPPWDQRFFAEVVLIDKTNASLSPLLYQLKESSLPLSEHIPYFKKGLPPPSRDAFVFLGDVLLIDKKKREIHLNSSNVVSYRYLIIATGTKPTVYGETHEEEFSAGIQTLIDAIRVKQNILFTMPDFSSPTIKSSPSFCCEPSSILAIKEIEKIIHPFVHLEGPAASDLAAINKRLYQIQV